MKADIIIRAAFAVLVTLAAALAATEGRAQKGLAPSSDPSIGQKAPVRNGLSADDLMGRWCGETTDYVFTRKQLTVTFHDDKSKRVLKITDIILRDDSWLNVMWGKDSGTGFEFEGGNLVQRPNTSGDMGPRRLFRRC